MNEDEREHYRHALKEIYNAALISSEFANVALLDAALEAIRNACIEALDMVP